MITVGTVTAYDPSTGDGIVRSHDGKEARFNGCVRLHVAPPQVVEGMRAVYKIRDAKGGARVLSMQTENDGDHGQWPSFGEIARVVCTVAWCHPNDHHRFLHHPATDDLIMVRKKGGRIRKDLRTGDKVIAEVVRMRGRLLALHTVRLPKDYDANVPPAPPLNRAICGS